MQILGLSLSDDYHLPNYGIEAFRPEDGKHEITLSKRVYSGSSHSDDG